MEDAVAVRVAADQLAEKTDSDVFLFNSAIFRPFDEEVITACCTLKRRSNAILILVTEGGDPDAAYRITRAFQSHFRKFTCLVPSYCKSAGTLILTGANDLVMTDWGELGPLDVQMAKKDEIGESESGLLVTSALEVLRRNAFSAFEHFFRTMQKRSRGIITFKTAAEYAAKLTSGLYSPIYGQIDPRMLAESSRAQAIAINYGMRLASEGKNIGPDALEQLISGYPSHGFVIDRDEASKLFENVRKPTDEEAYLIEVLGSIAKEPASKDDSERTFLSGESEKLHGDQGSKPGSGTGPTTPEVVETPGAGIQPETSDNREDIPGSNNAP